MAKYFRNRTANEWRKVLDAKGFKWINNSGDDEVWSKEGFYIFILVPSRNETIPMGTSDSMARKAVRCGLPKKEILQWWKENGFGE